MDSLLSYDQPLTYQDYINFENLLSAEENNELDKDSFLTIHKSRLFGEYNPVMQQFVADPKAAIGQKDDGAENKIHKEAALWGCNCFYCRKDLEKEIEDELNEDPKSIPRSFIHDDGFPIAKGRKTPKEINDEILKRMGKQEAEKKRREKNLEYLRSYLATNFYCAVSTIPVPIGTI